MVLMVFVDNLLLYLQLILVFQFVHLYYKMSSFEIILKLPKLKKKNFFNNYNYC